VREDTCFIRGMHIILLFMLKARGCVCLKTIISQNYAHTFFMNCYTKVKIKLFAIFKDVLLRYKATKFDLSPPVYV
jgi:hypothetical protein